MGAISSARSRESAALFGNPAEKLPLVADPFVESDRLSVLTSAAAATDGDFDLSPAFQQLEPAPGAAAAMPTAAAACKALDLASRGLAAAISTEHRLPLGSFDIARDAMKNVTKAANAGAELPAADLFSLGMSCIKLAAAASESPEAIDRQQAGFLLLLPYGIADAMHKQAASAAASVPAGSSNTSPHSANSKADSISSSSGSELAALLCARTLHMVGQALVHAGSTNAPGPDRVQAAEGARHAVEQRATAQELYPSTWAGSAAVCEGSLRMLEEQLLPAVQLPGAAGSKKMCAKALKQLQQQCTQLRQLVDTLIKLLTEAGLSWEPFYLSTAPSTIAERLPKSVASAALQLGQQLVQFSVALCSQLPVPLCCNNPGCVELRGASEQQLVAGKGSVCSRCRWVAAQEEQHEQAPHGCYRILQVASMSLVSNAWQASGSAYMLSRVSNSLSIYGVNGDKQQGSCSAAPQAAHVALTVACAAGVACRTARYCCKACQLAHWGDHKKVCKI
jgi:hypothetical protein